jgi:hypothetical protein
MRSGGPQFAANRCSVLFVSGSFDFDLVQLKFKRPRLLRMSEGNAGHVMTIRLEI